MVGVAISASLLPPAVNAGCLWALSIVTLVRGHENVIIGWSFNHTEANEKDEVHFFYPAIQTLDGTETTKWATETFLLGMRGYFIYERKGKRGEGSKKDEKCRYCVVERISKGEGEKAVQLRSYFRYTPYR